MYLGHSVLAAERDRRGFGSSLSRVALARPHRLLPAAMPPAGGKAMPKGKAKAAARPKAKAKAKTKVKPEKYQRQIKRRSALKLLNDLTAELDLGVAPLRSKETSSQVITKRVRLLETRCQEGTLPRRLRMAVEQFANNGGKLGRAIVPALGATASAPGGRDVADNQRGNEPATEALDQDDVRPPHVGFHRVLDASFLLDSKAFMLTYNSRKFTPADWPAFREKMRSLHATFKSKAWAANQEESVNASNTDGKKVYHMHAYFYWADGVGLYRRNTDELVFEDVRPRVDVNTATAPATFYSAACHGLWYVTILKKGTLKSATNFSPWLQYTPQALWLSNLWAAHKLSHEQYLQYSEQFGAGHANRRRDALDALRDERKASVQEHVAREMHLLKEAKMLKEPRQFEVVDKFAALFSGGPAFRRPVLAVVGGTNLGKSMLAACVLERIAKTMALASFLEITVEGNDALDLAEFDHRRHAGVLLDGVGDAMFLKKHREVLQGRPKVCQGGRSATMIYAYPFSLCKRAVIATFDLSASNLALLKTDHWLADEKNVMKLYLTEPAWKGDGPEAQPAPLCQADVMRSWTVTELASFLEGDDMRGPAAALRTAGVSGSDFMAWGTEDELVADLRLAPFTARKLLACRAKFLSA